MHQVWDVEWGAEKGTLNAGQGGSWIWWPVFIFTTLGSPPGFMLLLQTICSSVLGKLAHCTQKVLCHMKWNNAENVPWQMWPCIWAAMPFGNIWRLPDLSDTHVCRCPYYYIIIIINIDDDDDLKGGLGLAGSKPLSWSTSRWKTWTSSSWLV